MVILKSLNKITVFLMILAWACPFIVLKSFLDACFALYLYRFNVLKYARPILLIDLTCYCYRFYKSFSFDILKMFEFFTKY